MDRTLLGLKLLDLGWKLLEFLLLLEVQFLGCRDGGI